MGIYQLIGPVLSLSFSLTAAGYQTAISKLVAERTAKQNGNRFKPMFAALSVSIPVSLLCNFIIYIFADPIAISFLQEPRTASMLRILSFSIPVAAVHACINGYFYGIKKTAVPAVTQLLEQCIRVGCVYAFSTYALSVGASLTINVAVLGLVIGEIGSMLVSVAAIYRLLYTRCRKPHFADHPSGNRLPAGYPTGNRLSAHCIAGDRLSTLYQPLLSMVLPLTANRIVLNLLQSVESVSIPARLRLYGYDATTAISVYGVLTGMAMPLVFFPNALTSSVSVILLPMISEAYALGDMSTVRKYTKKTILSCFSMGLCCTVVFLLLGRWIGGALFQSELAGHFILTLSFLCPFLYLDTTLSSILNGLGKTGHLFCMNVASLLVRLAFVFWAIPVFGITGYLWGILASQILQSILYLLTLRGLKIAKLRS